MTALLRASNEELLMVQGSTPSAENVAGRALMRHIAKSRAGFPGKTKAADRYDGNMLRVQVADPDGRQLIRFHGPGHEPKADHQRK